MNEAFMNGTPGREFETHTTRRYPIGTQMVMADGRRFRYVLAGGSSLVVGTLVQAPANIAAHLGCTPVAAAVNALEVTVALGATATTKDQYAGGYLHVLTAGAGLAPIKSHPAGALSTSVVFTLQSGLKVAIPATASSVDLIANPYAGVIINPTSQTNIPVGVVVKAITNAQFGWIQTYGPCSVLTDGTVVIADSVMPSNGTAGSVETYNLTEGTPNTEIATIVGKVMRVNATATQSVVMLTLD